MDNQAMDSQVMDSQATDSQAKCNSQFIINNDFFLKN